VKKDFHAFHIVLTTWNSRYSLRMKKHGIIKGDSIRLSLFQEIELTKIIFGIIDKIDASCIAYNICQDHVHLVLVCIPEKLIHVIKTIKRKSSYLFNKSGLNNKNNCLWSQKFFKQSLEEFELSEISSRAGEINKQNYLGNTLTYIQTNRQKHNLESSIELEDLIKINITDFYGFYLHE
jgi:REP element-mobilizing transposase RayT